MSKTKPETPAATEAPFDCDACVIGAGPSGLATARALVDRGIDFDWFEKGSMVGGLWRIDNDNGGAAAYETLHLNSSRPLSEYPSHPMPEDWPDYPSHVLMARYFQDFADRHGLTGRVTFSTPVEKVEPLPGPGRPGGNGWAVTTKLPKEPFSILFSINKSALFDIFEARKGLEGMVASLAALRRTEDDLEHMQAALSGMEQALDQPAQYAKFEREFHLAIIEAARNNVISQLMDKLYRLLAETRLRVRENGSTPPAKRDEDFRNHKMIYKYIEAGDEHNASVAMVSHLLQFEKLLKSERDALD